MVRGLRFKDSYIFMLIVVLLGVLVTAALLASVTPWFAFITQNLTGATASMATLAASVLVAVILIAAFIHTLTYVIIRKTGFIKKWEHQLLGGVLVPGVLLNISQGTISLLGLALGVGYWYVALMVYKSYIKN